MHYLYDLIPFPAGVAAVLLGALGILVSLLPAPSRRAKWFWISAFVFAVLLEWGAISKQANESDAEATSLRERLTKMSEQARIDQIRNSSDLGYVKGRLDQAIGAAQRPLDLASLGAILAKTTGQSTRQSDPQLAEAATKFVGQMRAFEASRESQQEELNSAFGRPLPDRSSQEQLQQHLAEAGARLSQFRSETDAIYRSQFLNESIYFRDQLTDRLRSRGDIVPLQETGGGYPAYAGLPAFDGLLAGAHPISEAATYIKRLADQLVRN